jgi:hypothetical protein|tara:strand:+ start:1352 stop:1939 length:588 start_codon:yes stop_codon:yes gene_type:complete
MTKQNIFIINFNSLYEILEEIKENLSFNFINFENEEEFINENNLDLINSLIITKSSNNLLLNKKINLKNILSLNDNPLTLIKLIELINIQLIKLKFNYQSKIKIKEYELNLNSKFFTNKNLTLKLTEKEIEIILYLNKDNAYHDALDLRKNIWGYATDMETHTVETHIYRLRKKINDKFKDKNFILSHQNGYFIK